MSYTKAEYIDLIKKLTQVKHIVYFYSQVSINSILHLGKVYVHELLSFINPVIQGINMDIHLFSSCFPIKTVFQ